MMWKTLTLALTLPLLASVPAAADSASSRPTGGVQAQTGPEIYQHVCQGCHMPDGRGAVGAAAFPALAKNPKLENADYPLYLVLNGHGNMPWFSTMLSDTQIADVINFVRTHFGNDYHDAITPAAVAAQRGPSPHMER